MATTEAAVLARIKTAIEGAGYRVVDDLEFSRQPNAVADKTVTLRYAASASLGGFGFTEEARGTVLATVYRLIGNDYGTAKTSLLADGRTIRIAMVQDGAVTSGEYAVDDATAFDLDAPRGANYLIGRLRVPINFDAVLTA